MEFYHETKNVFCLLFSAILSLLLAGCGVPGVESSEITTETWEKFEVRLEYLRQQMKIPGLSAAVVIMDQKLVWAKGFGYVVTGPDGNLWFTEYWGTNVGRITPDGVITEYPLSSGYQTASITVGPDGNLWFTEPMNDKIGRITISGVMTEYPVSPGSRPLFIAGRPDGSVWVTEEGSHKIARIFVNTPPSINAIIATVDPLQLGQSINATVEFSDLDVGDTHTVNWDWGDGITETDPATMPFVTTAHVYNSSGVYTITATVTDKAGASVYVTFQYVVIYDPNGGFVTGGGWITSPAGAYTPNPSLTGKATFGFVSKYQKGAKMAPPVLLGTT